MVQKLWSGRLTHRITKGLLRVVQKQQQLLWVQLGVEVLYAAVPAGVHEAVKFGHHSGPLRSGGYEPSTLKRTVRPYRIIHHPLPVSYGYP